MTLSSLGVSQDGKYEAAEIHHTCRRSGGGKRPTISRILPPIQILQIRRLNPSHSHFHFLQIRRLARIFRGTFDSAFTLEGFTLSHKFHVGQLSLSPQSAAMSQAARLKSTKKLPERDGGFEYRIKNMNEPHERVLRESELRGV